MNSVFKYRARAGMEQFKTVAEVAIPIEPSCEDRKGLEKLMAYVNKYN